MDNDAMEAYLSVTAHFITCKWNMQMYVLAIEGSHTAENIVQWNNDIFSQFSVAESK